MDSIRFEGRRRAVSAISDVLRDLDFLIVRLDAILPSATISQPPHGLGSVGPEYFQSRISKFEMSEWWLTFPKVRGMLLPLSAADRSVGGILHLTP